MSTSLDFYGISVLLTSAGTFIATMVGLYRGGRRDEKLKSIEKHVNDLSDKREAMGVRAGTAEGHATGMIEGADAERANPTVR